MRGTPRPPASSRRFECRQPRLACGATERRPHGRSSSATRLPSAGALVLALCTCGCSALVTVRNPVPHLHEVSLVPVATNSVEETTTWTQRLRANLLRVDGVDRVVIVHAAPADTQDARLEQLPIAGTSNALVELRVLDFDRYYPPSASVEVSVYLPEGDDPGGADELFLDRQGRLAPASARSSRQRFTFQRVYRADGPETELALRLYALAQRDDDRGYDRLDRILRSSDRFIDFVTFQAVRDTFARLAAEIAASSESEN